MNIFSVQIGDNQTNKLGFDKVILVFDEQNVRNIFFNKYGLNTDYNGYIDKFFSKEIFEFHNKSQVIEKLSRVFRQKYRFNSLDQKEISNTIYTILQKLIKLDLFSVRQLKNLYENSKEISDRMFYNFADVELGIILTLKYFYESNDGLVHILEKCVENDKENDFKKSQMFGFISSLVLNRRGIVRLGSNKDFWNYLIDLTKKYKYKF